MEEAPGRPEAHREAGPRSGRNGDDNSARQNGRPIEERARQGGVRMEEAPGRLDTRREAVPRTNPFGHDSARQNGRQVEERTLPGQPANQTARKRSPSDDDGPGRRQGGPNRERQ